MKIEKEDSVKQYNNNNTKPKRSRKQYDKNRRKTGKADIPYRKENENKEAADKR